MVTSGEKKTFFCINVNINAQYDNKIGFRDYFRARNIDLNAYYMCDTTMATKAGRCVSQSPSKLFGKMLNLTQKFVMNLS